MKRCFVILVMFGVVSGLVTQASAVLLPNNLVICNSFDNNYNNSATGSASAGTTGNATANGNLNFIASDLTPGGQALQFPTSGNFADLEWDNAAVANASGSTGMTWSLWVVFGDLPSGAPGHYFNAQTDVPGGAGYLGYRHNTNDTLRGTSPGGFFNSFPSAADKENWHHLALTVVPDGSQFVAKAYLDGVQDGSASGAFDEITELSEMRIGEWTLIGEWRLYNTKIDEFRLYNVGMTDSQIAQLATASEIPEPATMALLVSALVGLAVRRNRRSH